MSRRSVVFYSAAWRGGSGWFVQALAQAMAENGGKVTLIAPLAEPIEREPDHPNFEHRVLPQGAAGKGSKPYRAARALYRVLWTFPALFRGRLRSREFLITHVDWLLVAAFQFTWIRMLGGRLTYIVHDATPHAWGFPERFRGLERALLNVTYRTPNRIVTLTEMARRELIADYGIAGSRITAIPHGAFVSDAQEVLPGDSKVLVFGMLRRNKRILESLQAMALLPPASAVRLIVAGAPHAEDPAYWAACETELSRLGDRVRTEIGFVPEARVGELLAECDAVLLPYEDFNSQSGVAILASFAKRVLVCTDVGGIGELIHFGLEAVRVDRPVDADSIADALLRFEQLSVEARRGMADRSREALASVLAWNRIGEEYWRLLEGEPADHEARSAAASAERGQRT